MAGILYVVATPIGNLGDITLRALEILKSVDFILCEDTRVTRKLLNHYKVNTPVLRYNEREDSSRFLDFLNSGKNLALVSDAGTPGISDPGNKLAAAVSRAIPIPGPSVLIAAASIAGFSMDKFVFMGFAPVKNKRKKFFDEVAKSKYPVILYESPHRILKTLENLSEIISDRNLVVCRELTKKFETIYRGKAREISEKFVSDEIRGEFVIIVSV